MRFYGNPSLCSPALSASAFFTFSPHCIVGAVYLDASGRNEMQICGKAETQMFPHCLLISYSPSAWRENTPPFRMVIGRDE